MSSSSETRLDGEDAAIGDLIAKMESAEGPDRELDVEIWALAEGIEIEWQGTSLVAGDRGVVGWCDPGRHSRNFRSNRDVRGPGSIPTYTASIGLALDFVGAQLPEWDVHVFSDCGDYFARVETMGHDGRMIFHQGMGGAGVERERWCCSLLSAALCALQSRTPQVPHEFREAK